jgi:SAM-dependent methyltransferase
VCLEGRTQCNLRLLDELEPRSVLEVGCGPLLLAPRWLGRPEARGFPGPWVVVEPALRYAERAREAAQYWPVVRVVQDYVEHAGGALGPLVRAGVDVLVVSGVVNETAEPRALLEAGLHWLKPGGRLIVSAPNAWSFHRLLAVRMGLQNEPQDLGERNRLLGQARVYAPPDLRALVEGLGLVVERAEGCLFKPFTHEQMALLMPLLGERGAQGLIDLGREFPMNSAEICLVAHRP